MDVISRWGLGASILMYHSIANNPDDPYSVTVDNFREQMAWMDENGFEVISLAYLLRLLNEQAYKKLRKKVVITFDDGYKDFVDNALPILLEYRAEATVFLVTDMLGEGAAWLQREGCAHLMTMDEVCYIKECGVSIGSHTSTHANLVLANQSELKRQLKESYDFLAELGEAFYAFSYPWGQWSRTIADVVADVGYECALVVGGHTRVLYEDRFYLPRITMRYNMGLGDFRSLLTRTCFEKEMRRKYGAVRYSIKGSIIRNTG